jgi:hypothetical protein
VTSEHILFLTLLAVAVLLVLDGIFNWALFVSHRHRAGRTTSYTLLGRILRVGAGLALLLVMAAIGVSRLVTPRHAAAARPLPTSGGWPVQLPHGEGLRQAVGDGSGGLFALTTSGMVEHGGPWVYHVDAHGRFDGAFGAGGEVLLGREMAAARVLAVDERRRRVYVLAHLDSDVALDVRLIAFDFEGRAASGFRPVSQQAARPNSIAHHASGSDSYFALSPDGSLIVVAQADAAKGSLTQLYAWRIEPDGHVDPSFGGSVIQLPLISSNRRLCVAVAPGGEIYVATARGNETVLMRLSTQGKLVTSPGEDGVVHDSTLWWVQHIAADSDGLLLAGLSQSYQFALQRRGRGLELDEGFARSLRKRPLRLHQQEKTHLGALVRSGDGYWVGLNTRSAATSVGEAALLRLDSTGEPDERFGEGGLVWLDELPGSSFALRAVSMPSADTLMLGFETSPTKSSSAVVAVPTRVVLARRQLEPLPSQ